MEANNPYARTGEEQAERTVGVAKPLVGGFEYDEQVLYGIRVLA